MPATYEPIATITLGSGVTSYTFSSIPSTYTDLVLIGDWSISTAGGAATVVQFNGDTGTNYSNTYIYGTGSAAGSGRGSNSTNFGIGYETAANTRQNTIVYFMNYSNTTTFKTSLTKNSAPSLQYVAYVSLWRSTAAISSIKLDNLGASFVSGSTFTLYGIAAA